MIAAVETDQKEETLAAETGQLEEPKASLAVTTSDGGKTVSTSVADNVQKAGDAHGKPTNWDDQHSDRWHHPVGLDQQAYIPNSDIGFVSVGQPAVVKIEAFPFTRYGVIHGRVTAVATDAIPEPDANQLAGSPTKLPQATVPTANVQRVQNLVFPVTIKLDSSVMNVDGNSVTLSPGMAATAEIKTGRRGILEYLFSPIVEVTS